MKVFYINTDRVDGYVDEVVIAKNENDARMTHPMASLDIAWSDENQTWVYHNNSPVLEDMQWPAPEDVSVLMLGNAEKDAAAGVIAYHFTPLGGQRVTLKTTNTEEQKP